MALSPDKIVFQERLGALPVTSYQAGERVLVAGSRTDRLLILKKGAVSVIKDSIEIAKVAEAGAIFGELSALLDQPHTADVCALERSEFYIAHAAALQQQDPTVLLYVAATLAQRLDTANRSLIELKNELERGKSVTEIGKTIQKIEGLLGASGASLVYAGYPSDPYA